MKLSKTIIVNAGLMLMVAGCATDGSEPKDFFEDSDETRASAQFMNVQANNGAREDATLVAAHFTGAKLNSLGTEKLTRMKPEEEGTDLAVNIDVPAGDLANSRRDAVIAYLKNTGVAEASIKVKIGPNDDLKHPAAEQLSRLSKTELGGTGDAASSVGGSPSTGMTNDVSVQTTSN